MWGFAAVDSLCKRSGEIPALAAAAQMSRARGDEGKVESVRSGGSIYLQGLASMDGHSPTTAMPLLTKLEIVAT
jgi:hypothetical protein